MLITSSSFAWLAAGALLTSRLNSRSCACRVQASRPRAPGSKTSGSQTGCWSMLQACTTPGKLPGEDHAPHSRMRHGAAEHAREGLPGPGLLMHAQGAHPVQKARRGHHVVGCGMAQVVRGPRQAVGLRGEAATALAQPLLCTLGLSLGCTHWHDPCWACVQRQALGQCRRWAETARCACAQRDKSTCSCAGPAVGCLARRGGPASRPGLHAAVDSCSPDPAAPWGCAGQAALRRRQPGFGTWAPERACLGMARRPALRGGAARLHWAAAAMLLCAAAGRPPACAAQLGAPAGQP